MKNPNIALATLEKELPAIQSPALSLQITDLKSLTISVEYLTQAKQSLKALTTEKQKLTKPLNATLKEIRSRYAPAEDALEAIIGSITDKQSKYQTALKKEQDEAQAKIAAKVESGYIKPETAINKLESLDTVESKVASDSGIVTFIEHQCFEVVELKDLPIQYHLPNEVAVRKAMLAGTQLPGVKYWTEQRPRNNRK